jgi:flagellar protein FlaG
MRGVNMDVKVSSQGGQSLYNINDNSVYSAEGSQNVNTNEKTSNIKTEDNGSISVEDAKKAADKINKLLEDKNTHIEYEQDKDFKQVMVMKVVDNDTNKVINQIPSKQFLDMVSQFCDLAGMLLDKKA